MSIQDGRFNANQLPPPTNEKLRIYLDSPLNFQLSVRLANSYDFKGKHAAENFHSREAFYCKIMAARIYEKLDKLEEAVFSYDRATKMAFFMHKYEEAFRCAFRSMKLTSKLLSQSRNSNLLKNFNYAQERCYNAILSNMNEPFEKPRRMLVPRRVKNFSNRTCKIPHFKKPRENLPDEDIDFLVNGNH